jgi:hypothetical protein
MKEIMIMYKYKQRTQLKKLVVKPKIKERRSKKWQTESKEHQFLSK